MVRSAVLGNNDIAKLIFWSLTIPDLCRVERVSAWLRVAASTDETFRLALESLLAPAVASPHQPGGARWQGGAPSSTSASRWTWSSASAIVSSSCSRWR